MISTCIVIPTYNESESLPYLLSDLELENHPDCVVVICDDSEEKERIYLAEVIDDFNTKLPSKQIYMNFGKTKGGRGTAVKRGMTFSLEEFGTCNIFIECDADGSHLASDIWRISSFEMTADVVIGSRYLPNSQIINWPFARRFFSRLLNVLIPTLFRIRLSDVTNGLRRYNRRTVEVIATTPNKVSGFLYLTEQVLILRHFTTNTFSEIPITFVNRTRGQSSVTLRDLLKSISSLAVLFWEYVWKHK